VVFPFDNNCFALCGFAAKELMLAHSLPLRPGLFLFLQKQFRTFYAASPQNIFVLAHGLALQTEARFYFSKLCELSFSSCGFAAKDLCAGARPCPSN
jgi:hypothetical protein